MLNLLEDPFLIVRLADGSHRPASILDVGDPSFSDLFAPRPDFRGALYQLLIGLLQFYAASTLGEWKARLTRPPTRDELTQAFRPYIEAFKLDTDGPAFMQDFDPLAEAEAVPIGALLIEAPGDNTVKKNLDHFVHGGTVQAMCPRCAATALFTLQINAPAGGAGHRVSLRGGGPLTTLLVPRDPGATLWQRLWFNVPPRDAFGYQEIKELPSVLPWMGPTRTSEKGQETTPEYVHPLQAYWSMPRRIRLDFKRVLSGRCDVCGEHDETLLTHYRTKNYGTNYGGAWKHPLTPYKLDPKELPLSIKGQPGGIGYRHWLGLALGQVEGKPEAAAVVAYANGKLPTQQARLWCFGFDMDNMKARCWYDSTLPFYNLPPERQRPFSRAVQHLLDAAVEAAGLLGKYVKAARFSRPGDVPSDSAVPLGFWQRSESHFYARLEALSKLDFESEEPLAVIYQRWLVDVRMTALRLFDEWVQSVPIEDADMRRVVQAQADLAKWLNASKAMKPLRDVVNAYLKEDA